MVFESASVPGAEAKECKREEAIAAETEASTLKTWPEVLRSYQRFAHCDDGAISEGYSSSVATLLADRWDSLEELNTLSRAHPRFQAFVLRHLDETMDQDQDKAIQRNVRDHCPKGAMKLCEAIRARFATLTQ